MAIQIPSQQTRANVGRVVLEGTQKTGAEFGASALGEAGQAVGSVMMQQAQRQQQQANLAAVQEQSTSLSSFVNDSLYGENGLYTKKGKNALTASDDLMTAFNKYADESAMNLTNDTQKNAFNQQVEKYRGRLESDSMRYQMGQVQAYENEQQQAYVANLQIDAANNFNDEQRVNQLIDDQMDSIRASGVLHGKSEDQISLEQMTASSMTHVGVVDRMISAQDYSGAKDYIEKYKDGIMPDKRDRLNGIIESARSASMAKERQRMGDDISDYVAYMNAGGTDKRQYSESTLKAVYGEEQGAKVYENITDAEAFSDSYNKIQFATNDELKTIIETERPTTAEDFQRESKQFNATIKAIQARSASLGKDPANYVMANQDVDKEYQNYTKTGDGRRYAASTTAEQERVGVPREMVTVLPNNVAKEMVNQYQQGGQNAAQFIQSQKQSWGDYFPQVMRDLNKAGLSPTAQVVSIMPDGNAANLLAEADAQGLKELKPIVGDDDSKTITADVSDKLSDMRETLAMTPNGPSSYNKLIAATNLLAHKYASMGYSISDAIDNAANEVVNDRYDFIDGYRVPINDEGVKLNTTQVRRGIDSVIDGFKDQDLYIPDHGDMPDDVAAEIYKKNLQVTAVTMNDDSGIVFVDQNGNTILDANSSPITMPWAALETVGGENLKFYDEWGF